MKACPFCGSTDIRYSIKSSTSQFMPIFHACFYCWECNTYGPRVLYKPGIKNISRRDIEKNEQIKQVAAEKWNLRS